MNYLKEKVKKLKNLDKNFKNSLILVYLDQTSYNERENTLYNLATLWLVCNVQKHYFIFPMKICYWSYGKKWVGKDKLK